eukprot:Gb_32612 [translate_table: standard]
MQKFFDRQLAWAADVERQTSERAKEAEKIHKTAASKKTVNAFHLKIGLDPKWMYQWGLSPVLPFNVVTVPKADITMVRNWGATNTCQILITEREEKLLKCCTWTKEMELEYQQYEMECRMRFGVPSPVNEPSLDFPSHKRAESVASKRFC